MPWLYGLLAHHDVFWRRGLTIALADVLLSRKRDPASHKSLRSQKGGWAAS